MSNLMTPISVLREQVQEGLVNLRVSDFPLINLLTKKTEVQDNFKWQVNVSTTGATGVSATAAAPAASSDTVVGASLPVGAYRFSHTIRLTKNDIAQAAAIGTEPLQNLFRSHVDAGLQRIMRSIETSLYTGTGNTASGGIVGLSTAVAATGAYAGLNPATSGQEAWSAYTDISSPVAPNTQREWSEALFAAAKFGIGEKGGNFDVIVAPHAVVRAFEELYIAAGKPIVQTSQSQYLASLGYTVFDYAGRPLIADSYAPANTAYFLDTRSTYLATRATAETQNINGLNVVIGQIAADTATAIVYELAVFPQLIVTDRRSSGIVQNNAPS